MTTQSQIQGFTTANIAEVEAATKALRASLRSEDYGALGIYSLGGASGTIAVSLGAAADVFQFQWANASNLCLLKRVIISAASVTAFTAQGGAIGAYIARSFSVAGTGGTSLKPSGNQNKLRTSTMGTTLVGDARISSTAALGAGTYTVDTNPMGTIAFGCPATAGLSIILPNSILFEASPGEYPVVFAQNEGFVIRNQIALPAAGTWVLGIRVMWTEIAAWN